MAQSQPILRENPPPAPKRSNTLLSDLEQVIPPKTRSLERNIPVLEKSPSPTLHQTLKAAHSTGKTPLPPPQESVHRTSERRVIIESPGRWTEFVRNKKNQVIEIPPSPEASPPPQIPTRLPLTIETARMSDSPPIGTRGGNPIV